MLFDEKDVDFLDTPYPSIWLCVIFLLIFINVFFALAETSLNESHKSRLERLLDDGNEDAAKALKLLGAEHSDCDLSDVDAQRIPADADCYAEAGGNTDSL